LLVAMACTRSNPAYQPEAIGEDASAPTADAAPKLMADVAPPVEAPPALLAPDAAADQWPPAPAQVSLTEPDNSPPVMPANPGGNAFGDWCGEGRVLIGVLGTSEYEDLVGLNSAQARCADLTLTSDPPWLVRTGDGANLARHGTTGPRRHDATCPPNQVVVGIEAAAGQWIDRMYVHCAALTVRQESRGYVVVIEPPTRLEVPLGPPAKTGFTASPCPAGKIAVGIEGNSGLAVDWVSLRCARPTLR
jgi:hypothetical protein